MFSFPQNPSSQSFAPKTKRQLFSVEEDEVLRQLVEEFGPYWKKIASLMNGRTTRQCRERYQNYLAPGLRTEPWSPEEDHLLEKLVGENGFKWSIISKFFNQRTDVNIKNRWASLHGRNSPEAKARKKMIRQHVQMMNISAKSSKNLSQMTKFIHPPTMNTQSPNSASFQFNQLRNTINLNVNIAPIQLIQPQFSIPQNNSVVKQKETPNESISDSIPQEEMNNSLFSSFFDDMFQEFDHSSTSDAEITISEFWV